MLKNDNMLRITPSIINKKHKYKCPECKKTIEFQDVIDCQICKLYLCGDCIKRNYVSELNEFLEKNFIHIILQIISK